MPSKLSFVSLSIGALLRLSVLAITMTTTMTTMTTNAYALQFDTDTGKGFISKGELQSRLGMNDSEFQAAIKNGAIGVRAFFTAAWTVTCSDGQILRSGGSFGFDLFHELRTNPQGKVTGIELTGYNSDHPDPWNQQLKDGPGSVCSSDDVSYTLEEVTNKWIEVAVSSVNERVTLPIN